MKFYKINLTRLTERDSFSDASREELRALLALISVRGEIRGAEDLSELAGISKARASASLSFWSEAGVIYEGEEPDKRDSSVTEEYESREEPDKSSEEIARSIKNMGLASLLSEIARLMDRPMLSTAETKKIVTVYTEYALNEEYIITLAAFLKEKERLTAQRLVADAERLVKKGIDSTEELEIYLLKRSRLSDAEWKYKRLVGIYDRALSPLESEMAEKWYCVFGYSDEIIGHAFSITTSKNNKLELPYMDAIITAWHEEGCKTLEDCEAHHRKFSAEWQSQNSSESNSQTGSRRKQKEKPRYGEFNVNDAFAKALERSYGEDDEE